MAEQRKKESENDKEVEAFKYTRSGDNSSRSNGSSRGNDDRGNTQRGHERNDSSSANNSNTRSGEGRNNNQDGDVKYERYQRSGGSGSVNRDVNPRRNNGVETQRYTAPRSDDVPKRDEKYADVGAIKYSPGGSSGKDNRRRDDRDRDTRNESQNRDGEKREGRKFDDVEATKYRPGGGDRRDRGPPRNDEPNRSGQKRDYGDVGAMKYNAGSRGGDDNRRQYERRPQQDNRDVRGASSGSGSEQTFTKYSRGGGGGGRGGDAIEQFERNNPDERGTRNYRGSGGGGGGNYHRGPRNKIGLNKNLKEKLRTQQEKKKSVQELQEDPLNPLSSQKKTFEDCNVPEDILKGIQSMGFNRPSSIQGKTLPLILTKNENIIAQSQSGTGKTACFAIGVLQAVDTKIQSPQVIVVSPTMELAHQNCRVIIQIAEFREDITILEATKGRRYPRYIKENVICGTPGTVLNLIKRGKVDSRTVKLLVLDEADAILEQRTNALRDQTISIKRLLNKNVRIFLFSATFEMEAGSENEGRRFESREDEEKENRLRSFAREFVPDPKFEILVPKERLTLETMSQYWILTQSFEQKVDILKDIYAELTIGQSIIFINTKVFAEKLREDMERDGHVVSILHSDVPLMYRRVTMEKFRKNESKVLITTNVLARGVDIPTVTMVINFDVPWNPQLKYDEPDYPTYLHRIGRTARFGGYGTAVTFVEPRKIDMIKKLERFYKTEIVEMKPENLSEIDY